MTLTNEERAKQNKKKNTRNGRSSIIAFKNILKPLLRISLLFSVIFARRLAVDVGARHSLRFGFNRDTQVYDSRIFLSFWSEQQQDERKKWHERKTKRLSGGGFTFYCLLYYSVERWNTA